MEDSVRFWRFTLLVEGVDLMDERDDPILDRVVGFFGESCPVISESDKTPHVTEWTFRVFGTPITVVMEAIFNLSFCSTLLKVVGLTTDGLPVETAGRALGEYSLPEAALLPEDVVSKIDCLLRDPERRAWRSRVDEGQMVSYRFSPPPSPSPSWP